MSFKVTMEMCYRCHGEGDGLGLEQVFYEGIGWQSLYGPPRKLRGRETCENCIRTSEH